MNIKEKLEIHREVVELAFEKGFKPKSFTTAWTFQYYFISKDVLINNTCISSLLNEIKDWLRDTYKIDVIITFSKFSRTYGYVIYYIENGVTIDINQRYIKKEEYEEALKAGLKESFKILK